MVGVALVVLVAAQALVLRRIVVTNRRLDVIVRELLRLGRKD